MTQRHLPHSPFFRQLVENGHLEFVPDYTGKNVDIYHDLHKNITLDVCFYCEQFRGDRKRVLDIGAGHGRIAIPLAQEGHSVVALDKSEDMLRELNFRKQRHNVMAGQIESRIADILQLQETSEFDFAILGFNTLHPFSPTERDTLFERTYNALKLGGLLFVDVQLPSDSDKVGEYTGIPITNGDIPCFSTIYEKRQGNERCIDFLCMRFSAPSQPEVWCSSTNEWWENAEDIVQRVGYAGFRVRSVSCDFNGNPLQVNSDNLVLIVEKG